MRSMCIKIAKRLIMCIADIDLREKELCILLIGLKLQLSMGLMKITKIEGKFSMGFGEYDTKVNKSYSFSFKSKSVACHLPISTKPCRNTLVSYKKYPRPKAKQKQNHKIVKMTISSQLTKANSLSLSICSTSCRVMKEPMSNKTIQASSKGSMIVSHFFQSETQR